MYRRASVLQAGTAVVGLSAGLVAWRAGGRRLWLAAAILLGSAVPLTLLVIRPVNDVLMSPDASRDADVGALFVQWGRLHLVRTMASGTALLCCLAALLQDQDCRISGERMPPLRQLWIRRRDAHSRE
jgi:uncharacterized membrane protein